MELINSLVFFGVLNHHFLMFLTFCFAFSLLPAVLVNQHLLLGQELTCLGCVQMPVIRSQRICFESWWKMEHLMSH